MNGFHVYGAGAAIACITVAVLIFRGTRTAYTAFSRRRLVFALCVGLVATGYSGYQVAGALVTHRVLCASRACNTLIEASLSPSSYWRHVAAWALLTSVLAGATPRFLCALLAASRARKTT